ncbi:MAG: hypothetical protein WD492_05350 [Alkalispirochaeta sp.]
MAKRYCRTVVLVGLTVLAQVLITSCAVAESSVVPRAGSSGEPLLVLGDFNAFRFMRPVRIIARAADLSTALGTGPTYHFKRGLRLFPAIRSTTFCSVSTGAPVLRRRYAVARAVSGPPTISRWWSISGGRRRMTNL